MGKIKDVVKVFAPASVANVGCGFDVLGFALNQYGDEIIARKTNTPGVVIKSITGAKGKLPLDIHKNTAGISALATYEAIGNTEFGVELNIAKKMPIGSGLGSSAASAVAGAMAINELLGRPFEKRALLPFAGKGEAYISKAYHLDNVAPALIGGLVLVNDTKNNKIQRIILPRGLFVVIIYQDTAILTSESRNALSKTVDLKDHVTQSANLAGLVLGFSLGNFDLIKTSLKDIIIEPQRKASIPNFDKIQALASKHGALGCTISGSGPTIFALFNNSIKASDLSLEINILLDEQKIKHKTFVTTINLEGAKAF